jgi:hypothetical protein
MLFQSTSVETGITNNTDYTAVMLLGCGFVVIHSDRSKQLAKEQGHKVHQVAGRTVGFALFTNEL